MSNPECNPNRELTSDERARLTLKAMMDICSLSISDPPEAPWKSIKFGKMIWKAFELGRNYEKYRVKDKSEGCQDPNPGSPETR